MRQKVNSRMAWQKNRCLKQHPWTANVCSSLRWYTNHEYTKITSRSLSTLTLRPWEVKDSTLKPPHQTRPGYFGSPFCRIGSAFTSNAGENGGLYFYFFLDAEFLNGFILDLGPYYRVGSIPPEDNRCEVKTSAAVCGFVYRFTCGSLEHLNKALWDE